MRSKDGQPVHVQFIIDNSSAVSWTTKLSSLNTLAQTIIRYLAAFEIGLGLIFSAKHIPGADNTFDDAGSRASSSTAAERLFANMSSNFVQVPMSHAWWRRYAVSTAKLALDRSHALQVRRIVRQ